MVTKRTLYHRIRFHHLLYVLFCFEKQKIWKQIELISMFWNKNNINVENCTKFIEHWDSNSWTKRRRKHKRELILLLLYEKTMCSSLLEFTCNWTVWLSASWVCVCVRESVSIVVVRKDCVFVLITIYFIRLNRCFLFLSIRKTTQF